MAADCLGNHRQCDVLGCRRRTSLKLLLLKKVRTHTYTHTYVHADTYTHAHTCTQIHKLCCLCTSVVSGAFCTLLSLLHTHMHSASQGRRLHVSKLYRISRSSQKNYESQESSPRPVSPLPSPFPSHLPSSFSSPAGINLSSRMPSRRVLSSIITLSRDDSGYIDAGLEQPGQMVVESLATALEQPGQMGVESLATAL